MSREAVQAAHEAVHPPENASSLLKEEFSEVTQQIREDGRHHEISETVNDSLTKGRPGKDEADLKEKKVLEGDAQEQKPGHVQPERYEEQHVHQVYEQIASHFSSTRYKPWPIVESFLQSLTPGSIGLDIGCGNGKYLAVNKDVFIIASDRSTNLVNIATQHEPHAAVVADSLSLPHQDGRFDFAICIAVVHHLSTRERRAEAVGAILKCLKGDGKALVYVWALEQKGSRRGWDEGGEQDVMVPWVMKSGKKKVEEGAEPEKTFQRYYHLYRKGELEEDVVNVGGVVVESGYEKDNWWAICRKGG
ncbi:tRNA methyltransferase, has a role in tRNA modification [Cadophora gregata]|uniref:tRNA methyltransferase, has a role in tRNA modification n=1 Tax=Cadophora gregata TaxID=51156 RepID=UPI0026DC1CC0|nr:tRNA methyltransferase, has a role in tRNA modification [Cadophora gregata]KAK0122152.1 tRNA methyltransferase, has a role in tRNA modification [Cadophora gregata]KAK0127634.1 tRNA methyltransferase, has a role in tRNA modification [Cadophora gregata f. sp. sojae]